VRVRLLSACWDAYVLNEGGLPEQPILRGYGGFGSHSVQLGVW